MKLGIHIPDALMPAIDARGNNRSKVITTILRRWMQIVRYHEPRPALKAKVDGLVDELRTCGEVGDESLRAIAGDDLADRLALADAVDRAAALKR